MRIIGQMQKPHDEFTETSVTAPTTSMTRVKRARSANYANCASDHKRWQQYVPHRINRVFNGREDRSKANNGFANK